MAATSKLMQEEGPYGASDRLDHPYGWTVVDTTSMYSKQTTLKPLESILRWGASHATDKHSKAYQPPPTSRRYACGWVRLTDKQSTTKKLWS